MDEPSLWDLQRLIERNHLDSQSDVSDIKSQIAEFRASTNTQMAQYVLREVYAAKEESRSVMDAEQNRRIAETAEEIRDARRRASTALWGAVGAVIATVMAAIILYALLGGKA